MYNKFKILFERKHYDFLLFVLRSVDTRLLNIKTTDSVHKHNTMFNTRWMAYSLQKNNTDIRFKSECSKNLV